MNMCNLKCQESHPQAKPRVTYSLNSFNPLIIFSFQVNSKVNTGKYQENSISAIYNFRNIRNSRHSHKPESLYKPKISQINLRYILIGNYMLRNIKHRD
jgi:hypothetical protein